MTTSVATAAPTSEDSRAAPPFARWAVLPMAGVLALVLLLTASRYGYVGDELYFRLAGQHPDWTYADQPPLLPLLAGLMDLLFPGSVAAMRVPAILVTSGGVVVAALIARELGGGRRAQVLTATAYVLSPFLTLFGRYLLTSTIDVVLTSVLTLLVVRWLRLRDDRLLLWSGLLVALLLQAKVMVVLVCAALAVALLLCGPRALLTRRPLWLGLGVAAVTAVPMVVWQAANGWPQLGMASELSRGGEDVWVPGPLGFVLDVVLFAGVAVGAVLLVYGVWRAARSPELRFLAVAFGLLFVVFLAMGWTAYYVAGLFPVLWAAGAVGLERVRGRWFPWVAVPVVAASAFSVVNGLPLLPLESVEDKNARFDVTATVGWPELVADVAAVCDRLTEDERRRAVILSRRYEPAGAVDRYGAGLPPVYSGHRGAWYFGRPDARHDVVVYVGSPPRALRTAFTSATHVSSVDNGMGVWTAFQGTEIWVLRGQTVPWDDLWPRLRGL